MTAQTVEEAMQLIESLKTQFDLKGRIWGDDDIISVLREECEDFFGDYPEQYWPQIVREVKASKEWSAIDWSREASKVRSELSVTVCKIATGVVTLERELGVADVTLSDFTDSQLTMFRQNAQLDDPFLADLMNTTSPRVRGLRRFVNNLHEDMERLGL